MEGWSNRRGHQYISCCAGSRGTQLALHIMEITNLNYICLLMFWTPPWLLVAVISPMLLALARMHLLCWIFCARSKDVLKIVLLLKSSKCHVPFIVLCFKSDLTPMLKENLVILPYLKIHNTKDFKR